MADWTITPVSDGGFLLDGGTLFGIVPKALWEKRARPDALNRIPIGLTSYLLRSQKHTVLVEAGIGDSFTPKQRRIYDMPEGRATLLDRLHEQGVAEEQVDLVLLSHLHLDHAGWCARPQGNQFVPTFPNAEYVVQRTEMTDATNPNSLTRGSYWPHQIEPITQAGQWRLLDGEEEILPGIRALVTGGHTRGHQLFLIEAGARTHVFLADFVATRHHLRVPYVMAYDLYPMDLVEKREEILGRAVAENWLLLWNHDTELTVTGIERIGEGHFGVTQAEPSG